MKDPTYTSIICYRFLVVLHVIALFPKQYMVNKIFVLLNVKNITKMSKIIMKQSLSAVYAIKIVKIVFKSRAIIV